MNADMFIKGQLANFCIREGLAAGGVDLMVAVAHVLRNRVERGWHGGDWITCLESALTVRGSIPEPILHLDLRKSEIKTFMQTWIDDIFHGSAEDTTNGALYYAELHNVSSEWFLQNIARDRVNHPQTAVIGLTTFFG